jgi:hypothetical protein
LKVEDDERGALQTLLAGSGAGELIMTLLPLLETVEFMSRLAY